MATKMGGGGIGAALSTSERAASEKVDDRGAGLGLHELMEGGGEMERADDSGAGRETRNDARVSMEDARCELIDSGGEMARGMPALATFIPHGSL